MGMAGMSFQTNRRDLWRLLWVFCHLLSMKNVTDMSQLIERSNTSKPLAAKLSWDAVYSCNVPDYKCHLVELKELQDSGEDPDCYTDFLTYDSKTFSRTYVSRVSKCDSIESNICETFNRCIVKYRGLSIINMVEGIRNYVMNRVVSKAKMLNSSDYRLLCPRIAEKIERGKVVARYCIVRQTLELVCEC
ncbi:hypothetical protein LINPERHAP2_LOCUS40278 [Linum perenne]